ncbi:hypothetical protein BMS3Bbin02_00799 [bacterium BMS3Bbin02]|nr:hypothetical protein BMS3Bbin02_00799 [bacterium BMS3Bbin02]
MTSVSGSGTGVGLSGWDVAGGVGAVVVASTGLRPVLVEHAPATTMRDRMENRKRMGGS